MRRALGTLLAALALAIGATPTRGDPPAAAPTSGRRPPTAAERATLVGLLEGYLDVESPEAFRHRIRLVDAVRRLQADGCDALADPDGLRAMLHEARPYLPRFDPRPKVEAPGDAFREDAASGVVSVTRGTLRLGISVPKPYADVRDRRRLAAMPPAPLIVALPGAADYENATGAKPWPGEAAIVRLYPKPEMKAVTDRWIVFAPVAPEGRFARGDVVLPEAIPLAEVWRRYPVDFERIVIDGGPEALLFAAAYPIYYAGVVVRGDATDVSPDLVPNLASTFVYVVRTGEKVPPSYETLKRGGHPEAKLTMGPPSGLPAWLANVKRTTPKTFTWNVKDKNAHRLAQWIHLEQIDETAPMPTLHVEVVDTVEDPNTVRIDAVGIRGLQIFLNDALVDLDREVRVVINGEPLAECRIESSKPEGTLVRLPAKFARTVDGTFDRKTVSIRKGMFYGWLYPVALDGVAVASDRARPRTDPDADALAERAFAVGDLEHRRGEPVEGADPVAQAIAWIRDALWRPVVAPPPLLPAAPADAVRSQAAWLLRTDAASRSGATLPDRPATAPGVTPPLPVVSALVLDRIRRERDGLHSAANDGPLAEVGTHADVGYFLREWVPGAYGGPGAVPDRDVEPEARQARSLRQTATRNAWIGAAAVAGLLGLAAVGGILVGRRRLVGPEGAAGATPPPGVDSEPTALRRPASGPDPKA